MKQKKEILIVNLERGEIQCDVEDVRKVGLGAEDLFATGRFETLADAGKVVAKARGLKDKEAFMVDSEDMVTDAMKDIGTLVMDSACETTVGTAFYKEKVLKPHRPQVSQRAGA